MKDRPRALAILIAVFLAGILVGSAGSYFYLKKSQDPLRRPPDFANGAMKGGPMPRPEPMSFKEILQLTPEQDAQGGRAGDDGGRRLEESRKQMTEFRKLTDAFHREQDAKIQAIIAKMNVRLNEILNADQRRKFAAWQKDFESRRRRPPRRRDFPPPE